MPFRFHPGVRDATTRARRGAFETPHGRVETPVFMPVGTRATVTGMTVEDLHALGAEIVLGNTYHLMLRPGPEAMARFGGIHRFMGWDRPVLTDSGGFQIFSLPGDRAVTEEGARFKSYVDSRYHLLSPERSIEVQEAIGADVMMVLDVCLPSTAPRAEIRAAMERTHRWALRSLAARRNPGQALFAIVQGGLSPAMRAESAGFLTQHPFDGFAIGGLAVGEGLAERNAEGYVEISAVDVGLLGGNCHLRHQPDSLGVAHILHDEGKCLFRRSDGGIGDLGYVGACSD